MQIQSIIKFLQLFDIDGFSNYNPKYEQNREPETDKF